MINGVETGVFEPLSAEGILPEMIKYRFWQFIKFQIKSIQFHQGGREIALLITLVPKVLS